jgi:hypothetical protein
MATMTVLGFGVGFHRACKIRAGQVLEQHFRSPRETDRPTSAATTETVPAYVPALDPDSDTSDPSRPPQNPFPAVHGGLSYHWRCTRNSLPGIQRAIHHQRVATLFPQPHLLAIPPSEGPRTGRIPVASTTRTQPATPEDPRARQFQSAELHPQTVYRIGRNLAVVGKLAQVGIFLLLVSEHRASSARPLAVRR